MRITKTTQRDLARGTAIIKFSVYTQLGQRYDQYHQVDPRDLQNSIAMRNIARRVRYAFQEQERETGVKFI